MLYLPHIIGIIYLAMSVCLFNLYLGRDCKIPLSISYLRIIFNNNDNPSFERSISNPTRGVGEKTLAKIRNAAKQYNISPPPPPRPFPHLGPSPCHSPQSLLLQPGS